MWTRLVASNITLLTIRAKTVAPIAPVSFRQTILTVNLSDLFVSTVDFDSIIHTITQHGLPSSITSHVQSLLTNTVCLFLIDVDLGLTRNNHCTERTRETSQ